MYQHSSIYLSTITIQNPMSFVLHCIFFIYMNSVSQIYQRLIGVHAVYNLQCTFYIVLKISGTQYINTLQHTYLFVYNMCLMCTGDSTNQISRYISACMFHHLHFYLPPPTCVSVLGFQSGSKIITLFAPQRFTPRPPTRVVSRNRNMLGFCNETTSELLNAYREIQSFSV